MNGASFMIHDLTPLELTMAQWNSCWNRTCSAGRGDRMMVHFTGRAVVRSAVVCALMFFAVSSTADAQTVSLSTPKSKVGFHGGVSIDPEQPMAGVWWETPPIGGRFHLR